MSIKKLNLNYKSDLKYTLDVAKLLGKIICLWPINSEKFPIKAIIKIIINIIACSLMTGVIISNILCTAYKAKNLDEKIDIIGPTFFYTVCLLKYCFFLYRSESFKKCLKFIKEDWMQVNVNEEREIMLKNAKFGRTMSIWCTILMYSGGSGHHFFKPLLSDSFLTEMNISVKPYPSPVYGDIFNTGLSPLHQLTFGTVFFTDFIMLSMGVYSFNISTIFLIQACGQFEIIVLNLHNLVEGLNENKKNTVEKRFIDIVKRHTRVLSYVSQIEKMFSEIFLVEILGCAINLSVLGYYAILSWRVGNIANVVSYIILLNVYIFNIYIDTYVGELLTIQARKVGETGYMIEWHQLPRNISLDLSFFIQVCQFPIKITAGKVVFLSMTTFTTNELHEKVEITGPTNFYIMSLSKYLLILLRGESVKKCFKYIENDWKLKKIELHRQVMLKNARYGRYLIIICAIFMYFGGFGYHLVRPLLSEKIITEMNQTVYPYPAPIYGKILNTGQSPYYELIFITLLIADFVLFSATVVSFSFASVLTLHACGQLEIITLYLNDLVNDDLEETKNSPHKRLIIIVNSHLTILRFVNQLESLLNEICLIEVVGCSVNMCLVGYYVIESWKREELIACFSYAIILTSFTFNIFIYCYLGELLTNQATKLAEKAYMIDWHRLPKTTSLDLLFFIRVCQFPAKISAGKIVILSMSTFSTVIRSSAAYFNALWKMSQ
ncbi:uncharacterized protein LOC127282581 [Leptopilina boulardi]|uniref:uncharacterized protein LOC127282581 n=1 Tax=Leptopilina boulardi TaxID=63433 RepID=UPI0021F5A7E5|nr:uncharacterized protein LOC127282581 [Leptopilina boulardi]